MYCEKCSHRIAMPAFSAGACKVCGKRVVSGNTPPNSLCPTCALLSGSCEHCGVSLDIPTVLLSIHPKWWELMLQGEKTLEVRKSAPKTDTPYRVVVYATAPVSSIVGEFVCPSVEIGKRAYGSGDGVYFYTGAHCVPLPDLHQYAGGKRLYGWRVENVRPLHEPIPLSSFGVSHPPQSWRYLR